MVQKPSSLGDIGGHLRRVEAAGNGDSELVRRCVARDPAALRELFERERYRVHVKLFGIEQSTFGNASYCTGSLSGLV